MDGDVSGCAHHPLTLDPWHRLTHGYPAPGTVRCGPCVGFSRGAGTVLGDRRIGSTVRGSSQTGQGWHTLRAVQTVSVVSTVAGARPSKDPRGALLNGSSLWDSLRLVRQKVAVLPVVAGDMPRPSGWHWLGKDGQTSFLMIDWVYPFCFSQASRSGRTWLFLCRT